MPGFALHSGLGVTMPPKAPDRMRWCKTCNQFLPATQFGNYLNAYCHQHWVLWNRAKRQAYSKSHPGYDSARATCWREANPDKVRTKNKATAAQQKAAGYPCLKTWIRENPEKARTLWREGGRRWRERNPEMAAAARHRKRARRAHAPGHHTGAELILLRDQFRGLCIYCQQPADTWDHITPMFRQGTNFAWNLAPACRSCNSRKQCSDPLEFIKNATPTPEGEQYIQEALQRHAETSETDQYVRNPYEKVSEGALWDEVRQVFKALGRVTESTLKGAKFNVSTFRRRLGTLTQINEILAKE
ncbi:MAG: hypothetical protein A2Y38_02715 [Spirochaetes bacterium GWB1_59_5]|nr:MAG: hypothetical protein A2Y38_02715 [Spirochaetes bacterium GWB1_59_5]